MGDFVKGNIGGAFPEPIRLGIEQHRRLDSFAAGNPHYLRSRRRLDPRYAHWRGILADIFYDHFLAVDWDLLCETPLPALLLRAEEDLLSNAGVLPDDSVPLLLRLLREWVPTYHTADGIGEVLDRMSRRIQRANPLDRGMGELGLHYGELREDFMLFLSDFDRLVSRG